MRINSIIYLIVIAIILSLTTPGVVLANEGNSPVNELSEIDAFHPPTRGDPRILLYNEWHYFNVIDENQNISFVIVLKLNGNIYNPNNTANVLLSYHTPACSDLIVNFYPINLVEYSDKSPDLRINNNMVMLTNDGYILHIKSGDGQTVFDGVFKPEVEPASFFTAKYEPNRVINWLVASPEMNVTGRFTINKGTQQEKTYMLRNARGYHDHNWGYWLWEDDIGWDWGQATKTKNNRNKKDVGQFTFSFGNVTNNDHTESYEAVLTIWQNNEQIAEFQNNEIQISHFKMYSIPQLPDNQFPLTTVINAISLPDRINIVFTTEYFVPIPIPIGGDEYLVIWEVVGTYDVSGFIGGKPIYYKTMGFLEYVA